MRLLPAEQQAHPSKNASSERPSLAIRDSTISEASTPSDVDSLDEREKYNSGLARSLGAGKTWPRVLGP